MSEEKLNKNSIKKVHALTMKLTDIIGNASLSETLSAIRHFHTFMSETIDLSNPETNHIVNRHFSKLVKIQALWIDDEDAPIMKSVVNVSNFTNGEVLNEINEDS